MFNPGHPVSIMFFLGTTIKTAMIDTMKAKYLKPAKLGIQCFQIDIPKRQREQLRNFGVLKQVFLLEICLIYTAGIVSVTNSRSSDKHFEKKSNELDSLIQQSGSIFNNCQILISLSKGPSLIPPSKKRCKELGGYSFTIGYSSDGTCQFAESNSIGIDGTCQDFEVCSSKEYP